MSGAATDSARLKNELYYNRSWKNVDMVEFVQLVDQYIRWYNERRIKMSPGGISPVEYREQLGLAA